MRSVDFDEFLCSGSSDTDLEMSSTPKLQSATTVDQIPYTQMSKA